MHDEAVRRDKDIPAVSRAHVTAVARPVEGGDTLG